MRWFLLCSATFLYLAVNNINGSEELSPIAKDLCKYLIHLKRNYFSENFKNISEELLENNPIGNNDTSNNNNYLANDNKQNPVFDGTSAISKILCNSTNECVEVQKDKPENDIQNVQIVLYSKRNDIIKNPDNIYKTVLKEGNKGDCLDAKYGNEISQHDIQTDKAQLYANPPMKFKNVSFERQEFCKELEEKDYSNVQFKTNLSECNENCSFFASHKQSDSQRLDESHNDLYIWRSCPLHTCLEYFLPFFKKCKLKVCKQDESQSREAPPSSSKEINYENCEDSYLSSQNLNKIRECLLEHSEIQASNKNDTSNTTDFCEESISTQTTRYRNQFCNDLDKPCCELDIEIYNVSKNVSCNISDLCNRNNSEIFFSVCDRVNECFQNTSHCKNQSECQACENTSRIYEILKKGDPQNWKYFKISSLPLQGVIKMIRNLSKKCPQVYRNTSCFQPILYYCKKKNKIDNSKWCSNTTSFDDYTADTDIFPRDPFCKCIKIIIIPIQKNIRYDSDKMFEESHNKQTISQTLSGDDSCSLKSCFDKEYNQKLTSIVRCKHCESKLEQNRCFLDNQAVMHKASNETALMKECLEVNCQNNKNVSINCADVFKSEPSKMYHACKNALKGKKRCIVSLDIKKSNKNGKLNYEKSLYTKSHKNKKCKVSSWNKSDNSSLADHQELINLCNPDTNTKKLVNLCKIITVVSDIFTKECSKKINSICELAQKKVESLANDCNSLFNKNITDFKSEKNICKHMYSTINSNYSINLINETESSSDLCKKCNQKNISTGYEGEKSKIKTISSTQMRPQLISCHYNNGQFGNMFKRKNKLNSKLKSQHTDSSNKEVQYNSIKYKPKEPLCNLESSQKENYSNDSDACNLEKQIEEWIKGLFLLGPDGSPRPFDEFIICLKDNKESNWKHIPLNCYNRLRCRKRSPRHWLTSKRYIYKKPRHPKLKRRNQCAKNKINFKPKRKRPRSFKKK